LRKNSIKNIRINEEVRKELQEIVMREIKDPRIHPMTSITRAEVAPDLKTCRVHVSVLGNEEALKTTIQGLRAAEGFIRHELARTVNLRNTPQLTFVGDVSIAYGVSMAKKIDEVIASDNARHVPDEDELSEGSRKTDTDDAADGEADMDDAADGESDTDDAADGEADTDEAADDDES
jgi:ribosome-binding factor A